MHTLILSDTHLNGFNEKKFNFLKYKISKVDKVILNGDFWEGYQNTFDEFIDSSWKHLFPLLKSKDTVYIFGNHDNKVLSDERTKLFSAIQTNQYTIHMAKNTLIFEHGNRLAPFFENDWKLTQKTLLLLKVIDKTADKFQRELVKRTGGKIAKYVSRRFNNEIKKKLKHELKHDQIYICGHTHLAEFDLDNQFINSGFIKHGLAQYLTIDRDIITPREEWYE